MNPFETSLWDVIDALRESDGRYRREAYAFVMSALGVTVRSLPAERLRNPEQRHLTGQELLAGAVQLARSEFGALAPSVFQEWGVVTGEDVGNIVFQLVQCGQLSARPEDTIEDFRGMPDLLEALKAEREAAGDRRTSRRRGGEGPEAGS